MTVVVVPAEQRRRIRRRPIFASAAAVLVVAGVIAAPLFVRPLDVIWFTLLRKLELYLPTAVLLHGWGNAMERPEAGPGARPCLACRGRPRGARVAVAERARASANGAPEAGHGRGCRDTASPDPRRSGLCRAAPGERDCCDG